jgi:hypothetical protein
MGAFVDLTGRVFGRLTVVSRAPNIQGKKRKKTAWNCLCECGSVCVVDSGSLSKREGTKSCGCIRRERIRNTLIKRNTTHGLSRSKIYRTWWDMNRRCCDQRVNSFKRYGAKGVAVSDPWRKFENFFADMGHPPKGCTLDRIDYKKGYSKENCRWADSITQANNKSSNHFIDVNGELLTLANAARKFNVKYSVLKYKINKLKMDPIDAIRLSEAV